MKKTILIFTLIMTASAAFAKPPHLEKWYQQRWCAERSGQTEVKA